MCTIYIYIVGVFIIHLHTECHAISCSGPLTISLKQKGKRAFTADLVLFVVLQNNLNRIENISKFY